MKRINSFGKKYFRVALAGVIGVSLFAGSNFVSASDDNHGYSFTIQAYM